MGKPRATKTNNDCMIVSSVSPKNSSGGKVLKNTGASWIMAIPPTKYAAAVLLIFCNISLNNILLNLILSINLIGELGE